MPRSIEAAVLNTYGPGGRIRIGISAGELHSLMGPPDLADEDIRAKDLRYANFQTELLKRRIEEIKQKFSNRRRAADE